MAENKLLIAGEKREWASIEDVIDYFNGEISYEECQRRVEEMKKQPVKGYSTVTVVKDGCVTFDVGGEG